VRFRMIALSEELQRRASVAELTGELTS
jgi:hypothetical protein